LFDPAPNGRTESGLGNLEVTLKYQFFTSAPHETIASIAFGWEAGGTGQKQGGAESFDVFRPALLFGKGMGDLPDALWWLRPAAVTGIVEGVLPSRSGNKRFVTNDDGDLEVEIEKNPNVFHWGFAVMYSLPYLQSFVRDVGIPKILNRLIPLVEIDINNPLDRGFAGKTTGTVNPGVIWAGTYFQLGVEAVVPVNERTGKNVGIRGQIHFFLDDLFPNTLGRPLFGRCAHALCGRCSCARRSGSAPAKGAGTPTSSARSRAWAARSGPRRVRYGCGSPRTSSRPSARSRCGIRTGSASTGGPRR